MKTIFCLALFITALISSSAQTIGMQLYTLQKELKTDVPGTLAKIKSWGMREIEGGGSLGLSVDEYKALLAKNGLKTIAVGTNFDELQKNPQKAINEAKTYGAQYVVCYWIPHQGDTFTVAETQKAVDVFNAAGKIVKAAGLTLCYHPHGYEFWPYGNQTLFDYLAKNTAASLDFELDVFWAKQGGAEPVALLKKYPTRFKLLHLKDRRPGTQGNQNGRADVESNVVLGQGDVGIAAIMKTAKALGIKHALIEDESSRAVEQVPQSLAYLRSLKQ